MSSDNENDNKPLNDDLLRKNNANDDRDESPASEPSPQYVWQPSDDDKEQLEQFSEDDRVDDTVTIDHPSTAVAGQPVVRGGARTAPWIVLSIVLLAALAYFVFFKPADGSGDAVAEVNGQKITQQDLYDTFLLQATQAQSALDGLITQELISQAADKKDIKVTDKDVDAELAKVKKSFPSEEVFDQQLAQQGLTVDYLRTQIVTKVKLDKIFAPEIKITDADLQSYYEQNKAQYDQPAQIRASHILVGTKEEAEAILAELKAGADFAALAKEKSTDTASSVNGGDLDFFASGAMQPEFDEAAFKLNVGELSGVVQTQFGFHIIKLTDKKDAVPAVFEDHKQEFTDAVFNNKLTEKVQPWLEKLRTDAKIVNHLTKKTDDASAGNAAENGTEEPAADNTAE